MLSPLESGEGILVTAAIRDITLKKEREQRLSAQNSRCLPMRLWPWR